MVVNKLKVMDQNAQQYMQVKMAMTMQNNLILGCYQDCVNSFKDTTLSSAEQKCLSSCAGRNIESFNLFQ